MYVEGLLWEFSDEEESEQIDDSLDALSNQGFAVQSVTTE